ncbi:MAG: protein O-mannosyl-transferase family [Polyangiales bacterium]
MRERAAVTAGIVTTALLALRAPLDLGPRDTGELSAAGWTLGVGHPTGAPLSMVLQQLASRVPLGTIAFRQGLLMAAATGLAVACGVWVALSSEKSTEKTRVIAVAACVVACVLGPTLLRAGTMTEVYATSLALVAGAWALFDEETPRASFALGALAGLGASAHVSARVLVPLVLVMHLARVRRRANVIASAVAFASVLPLVLYVPFAASRRPALSWGDARTAKAFLRHFLASDVRETFAARTASGHFGADARALFETTLLDLGVPLLSIAVVGLVLVLARKKVDAKAAVAVCVLLDLAYAAAINPMGIVDRQVGHVALLGLAILAADAVERVPAVAIVAVLGVGPRLYQELRGDEGRFVPETWTVPGALARVPPRALVVCDGDDLCGGALYAQLVEGARPDVVVVPRSFAERGVLLSPRLEGIDRTIAAALDGERPVLVDAGASPYPFPTALDPATPLVRAASKAPIFDAFARMASLDRSLCESGCTPLTRRFLAQAHIGPIGPAFASGNAAEAEALATAGLALDPNSAALWNDRAVARATLGRFDAAVEDARRSVELDPTRVPALTNLVFYEAALGRTDAAQSALIRLEKQCKGCLTARILQAGMDGPAALAPLEAEAKSKGKHDAWCRAFSLPPTRDKAAPPPSCR